MKLCSHKSEKLEAKEDLFIASVLHTKAVIIATLIKFAEIKGT